MKPMWAGGVLTDRPCARAAGGQETTERLDLGVRRSVLPSGTVVLSERMDSVRSIAAGVWVRRGTAHERSGFGGIAHVLEHMVFKGTTRRTAREIASAVESAGGSLDAYTTHEHTSFQVRVPADHLETGLDVLADLSFSPTLRDEDLQLEKGVVLEEIARTEDTPDDQVFELHSQFLYDGHPYGAPILGTRETVEAVTEGALRRLHQEAYRPENMVLAVAGQVDHDDLLARVRRLWPAGSPGGGEEDIPRLSATASGSKRMDRPGGRQVHLVAGAKGLDYSSPLRHAAVLVGQSLGGGMSSTLFQRLREELGLAYSVFSFQSFYACGGHVGAYLGTSPDRAAEAKEVLLDEMRKLSRKGLSADELRAVKEQIKGQILLSLESPAARMHRLAAMVLYGEPYRDLDALVALIDGVDPERAAEASKLYDPDGVAVLELWPA